MTQRYPHPGQQLADPERLGQIVIGTGIKGSHLVRFHAGAPRVR